MVPSPTAKKDTEETPTNIMKEKYYGCAEVKGNNCSLLAMHRRANISKGASFLSLQGA